jgi:diadenosine tetraphosphate (Ap4A) HIT family hydrolase
VVEVPRLITAAELDEMTPDERAAAFGERIVTDFDDLPDDFRRKVFATAKRLAAQRDQPLG